MKKKKKNKDEGEEKISIYVLMLKNVPFLGPSFQYKMTLTNNSCNPANRKNNFSLVIFTVSVNGTQYPGKSQRKAYRAVVCNIKTDEYQPAKHRITFYNTILNFHESFRKHCEKKKGENSGNPHFLFPALFFILF